MSKKNIELSVRTVAAICAFGALSGCSSKHESGVAQLSMARSGALPAAAMAAPAVSQASRADSLAYEHTVSIESTKELLPGQLRALEEACAADRAAGCTVLEVSLQNQQTLPSGSIRMRLAAAGVEPMIATASKAGTVTGRSTRAEDLAEPVADVERQLALMTLHRDRLTKLMEGKDLNVDQLITVSRELATVQSQIDSFSTQRADLRRRIDTDLLTISLSLPAQEYAAEQSPITDALRYFGSDFREAVGMVVRFLAVLAPWLVIILPGLFLLRLFWRWMGRMIVRREQRA